MNETNYKTNLTLFNKIKKQNVLQNGKSIWRITYTIIDELISKINNYEKSTR